ncbi:hypothetical protein [Sphingomonas sp.]|uniref:hypothetical protein n=1 Tax=Sphingomonas sp. TaxID=28214 RepID=UPI001EB63F22|nr:hypothetical protein [Sphingomonas sp.]MBX3594361.1 hypothetical protein [Sphingomonas sp.]
MAETTKTDVKLPRISKGKRSRFFDDPAIDQVMTFLLELMAEVSAMHERQDTVERLLAEKGTVTREEIEAYRPSAQVEAARADWNNAFIRRVMRLHDPD